MEEIEKYVFEEIGFLKNKHSFYEYTYKDIEFVVVYSTVAGYTMQCTKKDNGEVVKFAKLGRYPYKEMVENIMDRVVKDD